MKSKKDWLIAIVGVMSAVAIISIVTYILFDKSVADEHKTIMWLSILVGAIISHIVALVKVKRGTLTVYRGWKDFGVSCIWPIAVILAIIGFVVATASNDDNTARTIGWTVVGVFAAIGIVSMIWMFFGAFANNRGRLGCGLLALVARTIATLFFVTYVSKLLELKDKYEDGNVGVHDYIKAVIGFIIFGIWFKMLVVPLVKDNREEIAMAGEE